MSDTLSPAALAANIEAMTSRLDTLRENRERLAAELGAAASVESALLEQVKTGAATAEQLGDPQRQKENLRRVVSEIQSEIETLMADRSNAEKALTEAQNLAKMRELATQAEAKAGEFGEARQRTLEALTVGLLEMHEKACEWSAIQEEFRRLASARIYSMPKRELEGYPGAHGSNIVNAQELLAEVAQDGTPTRNVQSILPRRMEAALACKGLPLCSGDHPLMNHLTHIFKELGVNLEKRLTQPR